jgi:hypothetical protein
MYRVYLRTRKWVDRDLAEHYRPFTPLLGFMPPILVAVAGVGFRTAAEIILWGMAVTVGVVWTIFVLWRVVRAISAAVVKGDLRYDRSIKYRLSWAYRRSESVTAARRRSNRHKGSDVAP